MKRIQLFEIEDFAWLPTNIRAGAINLIIVFHRIMGTSQIMASLIKKAHSQLPFNTITDLGSGSGGPMIDTLKTLNKEEPTKDLKLTLTDLHPNPKTVQQINDFGNPNLSYKPNSVNAAQINESLPGLKTMVASFHHMPVNVARQILQTAQNNKQPILIYEIAKNNIPFIVWLLFLPLGLCFTFVLSLILTFFVRPLSINQLVFTFLIPVIPIVFAWDGQASIMRTYTFKDIEELIGEKSDDYTWEIDDALDANGKKKGYYVLGLPK